MIRRKQALLIAFGVTIYFFVACSGDSQNSLSVEAKGAYSDTLIGKKINLPDSMEVYAAFKDSLLMDSAALANYSSYRVYAFINVSCSSCIPDIDKWNDVIPALMKNKVPVILLCSAKDNFEYVKFLFESGKLKKFPFPVYLDVKNRFYKLNPFINEFVAHQAVLVNAQNMVIATGNPVNDKEVITAYTAKITGKG